MTAPYDSWRAKTFYSITTQHEDTVTGATQVQPYGVRFESVFAVCTFVLALAIAAAKGWGWI